MLVMATVQPGARYHLHISVAEAVSRVEHTRIGAADGTKVEQVIPIGNSGSCR